MLREDDVVLTARGKPVALLVGVGPDNLGDVLETLRQVRAQMAVSRMRRHAAASGLDTMTIDDIDHEIRAARDERRSSS
jgi:antitoxin (DNA-binding transcriptional repressor) of toxin-antitoxin stability system